MKKLIMLIGAPGTGKSTWANEQEGYRIFSTDSVYEAWGRDEGLSYNEAVKLYPYRKVEAQMIDDIGESMHQHYNVIWDQTNMTVASRKKKLKKIPMDYEVTAVVFKVPEKEIARRLKDREEKTGKHISMGLSKSFLNKYEPPTEEEGFHIIKEIDNG